MAATVWKTIPGLINNDICTVAFYTILSLTKCSYKLCTLTFNFCYLDKTGLTIALGAAMWSKAVQFPRQLKCCNFI